MNQLLPKSPNPMSPFDFDNITDAFAVFLTPLQKYFFIKNNKEIYLKRLEYAAEARIQILKTIENIAKSGNHNKVLYDMLMEAYNKTLI